METKEFEKEFEDDARHTTEIRTFPPGTAKRIWNF